MGCSVGVMGGLVSRASKHRVGLEKLIMAAKVSTGGQEVQGISTTTSPAQLPSASKKSDWQAQGWHQDCWEQWSWLILWVKYVPSRSHITQLKVNIFENKPDLGLNFDWPLTCLMLGLFCLTLWDSIFFSVNQYNNTCFPQFFGYITIGNRWKCLEKYPTPHYLSIIFWLSF